ncbi:hypothetical protein NDU88_000307 [Pleurodeles waltl]|uniref:Endonuclease/exonuclease/phosphatase domain-containing protein n=1 Tax=Pleurodeles waltl TaxID=8319 RepID=A0AAV7LVH3_PLEWA|nr:hypothetical protein NDU88_000307 [Pleurodeles waltl]
MFDLCGKLGKSFAVLRYKRVCRARTEGAPVSRAAEKTRTRSCRSKLGTMAPAIPWVLLLVATSLCCPGHAFKVASFNIARFSMSKVTDTVVRDRLVQILRRYELISIQEVMSAENEAIISLVRELSQATGLPYNVLVSDHLGRSNYREKYAYVYREDILKPTEWYHFDDGCENCGTDTFIREPFIARFSSLTTVVKDLVLVSIHTSPDYAVSEVDALFDVWEDVQQRLLTQNILILGDYNADCKYVTSKHWPGIRLRHAPQLHWLISDDEDTTVSENTHCAYDRFVASGVEILDAIIPETATAFNYHVAYGLSYEEDLIEGRFIGTSRREGELFLSFLLCTKYKRRLMTPRPIRSEDGRDVRGRRGGKAEARTKRGVAAGRLLVGLISCGKNKRY